MKLPQLTLRDLFWLILIVAMACGWWIDQRRDAHERRQLGEALLKAQEKSSHLRDAILLLKQQLDESDDGPYTIQVDGETIESGE